LFGVKKVTEARGPKPSVPPLIVSRFVEGSFGALAVERGVAQAALQQLGSGMQVQFIGDSKVIIDCLIGKASTSTPDMRRSVMLAHTALQTLVQCFHIKAPGVEEFGQQVPRSDN